MPRSGNTIRPAGSNPSRRTNTRTGIGTYPRLAAILADDASYFLNIKPHADGGQRSLYVADLLIAHVRQWGWWFIDELCWRKTDNGVPGGWGNRFKNAFEPIYHFTAPEAQINFVPSASAMSQTIASTTHPTTQSQLLEAGCWGPGREALLRMAERTSRAGKAAGTVFPIPMADSRRSHGRAM